MFPREAFPVVIRLKAPPPSQAPSQVLPVPSLPLLSGECRGEVVMIIVLTLDIQTVLQSVSVSNHGSSDLDKMA